MSQLTTSTVALMGTVTTRERRAGSVSLALNQVNLPPLLSRNWSATF